MKGTPPSLSAHISVTKHRTLVAGAGTAGDRAALAFYARARAEAILGYDGPDLSRAAVRHAAELFQGRPTVVATVWEPGLAMMATIEAVDRSQLEHALRVAEQGAELARWAWRRRHTQSQTP